MIAFEFQLDTEDTPLDPKLHEHQERSHDPKLHNDTRRATTLIHTIPMLHALVPNSKPDTTTLI